MHQQTIVFLTFPLTEMATAASRSGPSGGLRLGLPRQRRQNYDSREMRGAEKGVGKGNELQKQLQNKEGSNGGDPVS